MKKIIFLVVIILVIIGAIFFTLQNKQNNKVFAIKDRDFYLYKDNIYGIEEEYRGIKLLEYDNTNNNYASIYYILYDYTTDPSYSYKIKVQDELGNNLLKDMEEDKAIGGVVCEAKIKKIPLNSRIVFFMYEYNDEEITSNNCITIDLSNELEGVKKIDQTINSKEGTIGDVKFKYIDSEYVYFGTTEHAYSKELLGQNSSIPVSAQYGNRLITKEHIEFWCQRNVNNLNTEEAFENMKLITEVFGQYGLSDVYGLTIANTEDVIVVTFEDMIDLCKGKTIVKDSIEYNKDSFDHFAEIVYEKEKDVEIGHGIKAIKYTYENNIDCEYYMFQYKDNIYYITVPTEVRVKTEITSFLNSLKVIDEVREKMNEFIIEVNNKELVVKVEDNSSAKALLKKLEEGDVTINAQDYGNFEKVGELGFKLPRNDKQITTKPGDVILYQGTQLTLYYGTNSWNFTKIGEVTNVDSNTLKSILGDGNVTMTLKIK